MFFDWVLLDPAIILSPFRIHSIFMSTIFFSLSVVASCIATSPLCGEPVEKANSFSLPFFLHFGVVHTLLNSSYSVSLRLAGFEDGFPSCFIFYKTDSSNMSSSSFGTTTTFSGAGTFPHSIWPWNSFNAARILGLKSSCTSSCSFLIP